ncbi:MAG TPA: hypothetical protein VGJ88_04030 [Thermoanaerobaculia bacterium]|jgi:hypothetical protein
MTEVAMLQAALFQLRGAIDAIEDPFLRSQIRLGTDMLANAVASAENGVNAAAVNEIEFALNDVAGAVGELTAPDAAKLLPMVELLQRDVVALKELTALAPAVIASIRALQAKLKIRRGAIERQTFVENASEAAPPPHPPEELRADALPLRDTLASSGFTTPGLDTLIDDPASLRFHSINEIIDELDVIAG